jgi:DNA-binding NarL/FixJ family response regulator
VTVSVLLIEDMKPIQSALVELLCSGADMVVAGLAATEAEANLWLRDNPGRWDLAIVDLVLAEGTGMRVIANARKANRTGRIVVFSDFVTPGIEAHCFKLGADAMFDKSQGPHPLLAYCRQFAQRRNADAETGELETVSHRELWP